MICPGCDAPGVYVLRIYQAQRLRFRNTTAGADEPSLCVPGPVLGAPRARPHPIVTGSPVELVLLFSQRTDEAPRLRMRCPPRATRFTGNGTECHLPSAHCSGGCQPRGGQRLRGRITASPLLPAVVPWEAAGWTAGCGLSWEMALSL